MIAYCFVLYKITVKNFPNRTAKLNQRKYKNINVSVDLEAWLELYDIRTPDTSVYIFILNAAKWESVVNDNFFSLVKAFVTNIKMSVIDDATLLKMAEAEILGEAKRAAARHSTAGVSGWQPVPKTNKMFLTNTLLQTMASNRVQSRKIGHKGKNSLADKRTERKLLQKKSKTDMDTNFVYIKPNKRKEKTVITTKTNKFNNSNTSLNDKKSKSVKEVDEKYNVKKIKLKKV